RSGEGEYRRRPAGGVKRITGTLHSRCTGARRSAYARASMTDDDLIERARGVLRRAPLIDGHNDVLWELRTKAAYDLDRLDLAEARPELMTDIARIRAG